MKSNMRHEVAPSHSTSLPNFGITYECKDRISSADDLSKSCHVYGQVSGRTERSEQVLGITSRITNPAATEKYVQTRPTHRRPVEATEASTDASAIGRSFKSDCKLFTSLSMDTLFYLAKLPHFILYANLTYLSNTFLHHFSIAFSTLYVYLYNSIIIFNHYIIIYLQYATKKKTND